MNMWHRYYTKQKLFRLLGSATIITGLSSLLFGALGAIDVSPLRKARSYIDQALVDGGRVLNNG